MELARTARQLAREVDRLRFGPPVTHVYNPLRYAWEPHAAYLERARRQVPALLVGMNPGPFGMAQTGVPFGEVESARGWLGIEGRVAKPAREHPRRPVEGFGCKRKEVSGTRFWSWARRRYRAPEAFFERFFVWNYCPLLFLEESGRNRTPDRLPAAEREPLFAACDRALRRVAEHLEPRRVVGIGRFAERRARAALAQLDVPIGCILHPSPASPAANGDWYRRAERELSACGVRM